VEVRNERSRSSEAFFAQAHELVEDDANGMAGWTYLIPRAIALRNWAEVEHRGSERLFG